MTLVLHFFDTQSYTKTDALHQLFVKQQQNSNLYIIAVFPGVEILKEAKLDDQFKVKDHVQYYNQMNIAICDSKDVVSFFNQTYMLQGKNQFKCIKLNDINMKRLCQPALPFPVVKIEDNCLCRFNLRQQFIKKGSKLNKENKIIVFE